PHGGEGGYPVELSLGRWVFDLNVRAIHVAEVAERLPKGAEEVSLERRRGVTEVADPGHFRRLLSASRERHSDEDSYRRGSQPPPITAHECRPMTRDRAFTPL